MAQITQHSSSLRGPDFYRDLRRATVWPAILFGAITVLLMVLTGILFRSAALVAKTDQIIAGVTATEKIAVEMETGLRAYQLTGNSLFLVPWDAAIPRIHPEFDALAGLVKSDSELASAVARQRSGFDQWYKRAKETLAGIGTGEDVRSVEWDARGKEYFDVFRKSSERLTEEQKMLRDERVRRLQRLRTSLFASLVVLAVVGVPLLVAAFRRVVRRLETAYGSALEDTAAQRDELHTLLNSIGDGVLATNASGEISFLNPVAETLTGWTNQEARNRTLSEVFPIFNQKTGQPAENPVERVLREHVVVELANHTVLRRRDGKELPIEDSAAPIFNADGKIQGVILVFHDVTEKYARADALREAEWNLRLALQAGEGGAWVIDVDRGVVVGDAMIAHSFNVPLEKCRSGAPIADFIAALHEGDRSRVEEAIDHAITKGDDYRVEFRAYGVDGVMRWFDSRGRVQRDGSGKALRVPGMIVDITFRKLAELELRASEARSRAILDTSLDAVLLMDAKGQILGWNPAAERIFGWSAGEVLGSDLAGRIIPERMREAHHRGLAHLLATGEGPVIGRRLELSALRRDGTEFPVELAINPLPGLESVTFVGFLRDISQRKAVEAELAVRASLAALRADIATMLASNNSADDVLKACCNLLVQHLDAAFARIWILDEGGSVLILRASAGLYTHLDGPHAQVPVGQFKIGRIAQQRRAHLSNDVRHDPNISDPAWAEREGMQAFAGYPLIVDGRVLGVLALFSCNILSEAVLGDLAPITDAIAANCDRRAAEKALIAAKERAEVASRAKDNFMAALSHELRTPLTPVLMTAAELSEDPRLPADVRVELGMIERNIALEARLIDDLLDLTRITKGKLQLREETCDVHSIIGLAIEIVRNEAQTKPVSIDVELNARRSALRGDSARLQQVFWNLLRNAIKFTPAGGRVAIRTRDETNERLRIEVVDNGIGLGPEALHTIFHPFEQAGRDDDHRFGGLGLGLAIVRAIVDLHGGVIRAESDGPDLGATFIVELPGVADQATGVIHPISNAKGGASNMSRGAAGTTSLRLLLVEDHEATLAVLKRLLVRLGHLVVPTASVAAAVAAAETGQFDVVISDLGLPDGTGLELIAKLRSIQPGLRGIALSGYGMEDDLDRSVDAGFAMHLVKPVDFNQLVRALREVSETPAHKAPKG